MYKEKIKMLALDLDGTTLTSKNTLSKTTKTALIKAIDNGLALVVASGRPFGTMHSEILAIDGIDYIISSNGAAIYDKNRKCIYRKLLNENDVLKILDITQPYDLIFEAFIDGLTYTDKRYVDNPEKFGCTNAYIDYVRSAHGRVEDMRSFIFEHRSELDSIELLCTDKALRNRIRNRIKEAVDGVYITSSSENFVEFMNKNATKSNAIKILSELSGIDIKNVCACGNGDNDADMISLCGLGVAVANASALCIECADMLADTNDNDGVAKLIDYIMPAE